MKSGRRRVLLDVGVSLQQRQEQERSNEKSSVSCGINEAMPSADTLSQVTSDTVQPGSVSSVTTTATSSDVPPSRPLIPFGQGWLAGK